MPVNGWKSDWLEFALTGIGLVFYDWLFRDTHFIGPLELKTNDSQKVPIVETLINPINFFNKKREFKNKKRSVTGSLILSSYNSSDFHAEIWSVLLIFLSNPKIGWNVPSSSKWLLSQK